MPFTIVSPYKNKDWRLSLSYESLFQLHDGGRMCKGGSRENTIAKYNNSHGPPRFPRRFDDDGPAPPPAPLPEPKRKARANDKRQSHQQPTKQRRKGEAGEGEKREGEVGEGRRLWVRTSA